MAILRQSLSFLGFACHKFVFWLANKTGRKFAELCVYCQQQKCSSETLVSCDRHFMNNGTVWRSLLILWSGNIKQDNYIHSSHICCSLRSIKYLNPCWCLKSQHTFDVGSRQKMTDMDSQRATTKCIATALVCQPCWVSCSLCTLHAWFMCSCCQNFWSIKMCVIAFRATESWSHYRVFWR